MKLSILLRKGKPFGDYACLANAVLPDAESNTFTSLDGKTHKCLAGDEFIGLETFGIRAVWDITVPGDPRVRSVRFKGSAAKHADGSPWQYGGTNREFVTGVAVPASLVEKFQAACHYVEVDGQVFENHSEVTQ